MFTALIPLSTTIVETWATDISKVGPIYPFVGTEVLWFIAGLIFWVWFHVAQFRIEDKELAADAEAARDPERLKRVFAEEAEE